MAEFPQWYVDQACQYNYTDGPLTVSYFTSRPEILDPYYCMSTEMPDSSSTLMRAQKPAAASAGGVVPTKVSPPPVVPIEVVTALETLGAWKELRVNDMVKEAEKPVEPIKIRDLTNWGRPVIEEIKVYGRENIKSTLNISWPSWELVESEEQSFQFSLKRVFKEIASKFKSSTRKLRLLPAGQHPQYEGSIEISKEASLLLSLLNSMMKVLPAKPAADPKPGKQAKENADKYECAVVCGISTQFNPGGMWIVEEFFNDEED